MEKKALPILVYKILYEKTCPECPMTFIDIAKTVEQDYGYETNRKQVSACVDVLEDVGADIVTVKNKGVYLASRPLETGEIKFLIDCICSFSYIDSIYSADLISKLCSLGGKPFADKHKLAYKVKDLYRGDNKEIFFNVEILDEAISLGNKVTFTYNKFKEDKKLHPTNVHTVSPFYTFLSHQNYYLMGASDRFDGIGFFRIDKITNLSALEEQSQKITSFEGYRSGVDIEKLASAFPYMYSDSTQMIEIVCKQEIIDDLINWFGKKIKIKKSEDGEFLASVIASTKAMEFWLMQYGKYARVISPQSLVDKMKENIENMCNNYGVKNENSRS